MSFGVGEICHMYVILGKLISLNLFLLRKGKTSPPFLWLLHRLVTPYLKCLTQWLMLCCYLTIGGE